MSEDEADRLDALRDEEKDARVQRVLRHSPASIVKASIDTGGYRDAPGECKVCDEIREEGLTWHPPHTPSQACRSGKKPHCSCASCF